MTEGAFNSRSKCQSPTVTDTLSKKARSARMALIRSKNTKPEMAVRRLLHGLGYRYRIHVKGLPGTPDLVFRPRKRAVFVHGCFWHGHHCRLGARVPKSRVGFWVAKIKSNRLRDKRHLAELKRAGWRAVVIWECQLKNVDVLTRRLTRFLDEER
jgi:DNA mismatch endonuclease Vsr